MIDYIRGTIVEQDKDSIVIEANAIGYRVFCARPERYPKTQQETLVYIHYHVREDAVILYGFKDREEQYFFRLLIEVSGIGPKVALAALSGAKSEQIATAIVRNDITTLIRLPGIGRKTAQRMVLDLKDKLENFVSAMDTGIQHDDDIAHILTPDEGVWAEAREAIVQLGFKDVEWQSALPSIQKELAENSGNVVTGDVVKAALRKLYRHQ